MQSRNKQEGYFDGFIRGKYCRSLAVKPGQLWSRNTKPTNRKQRKQDKLEAGYYSPSYR